MNPMLLGIIIGVALALLYFAAVEFFSSKILSYAKITSIPLALIGFAGRLTLIGIVFYILARVKWIHFQTALITFAAFFTLITIWKATRVYRETKSLTKQQTEI